ncbi:hypothetical protein BH09ACT12_BH09ACT12_33350 [soil metagenome]
MIVLEALPWLQIALAGALSFAEAALGLGAIFPGEVAIVALAASLDGRGTLLAMTVVAVGASLGDHVGYFLGRRYGARLAQSRLIEKVGVNRWNSGASLMKRYGVPALLVSRLLPFVRTVMPAVAGAARLPYVRFLAASALGSAAWAALWVGAGGVLDQVELFDDPRAMVALAVAIIVALLVARLMIGKLKAHRAPAESHAAHPPR